MHLTPEQIKFFLSWKDKLNEKKILLHHFTCCGLKILDKIEGTFTFKHLYDAIPYLDNPYFMVRNNAPKEFTLSGITTKEYLTVDYKSGKDVEIGDIITLNNVRYFVQSIIRINKPKDHPLFDLLSDKEFNSLTGKQIILRLGDLDKEVLPTKDFTIYGVEYVDISNIKDFEPITINVVKIGSGEIAPFKFDDTMDITPADINNFPEDRVDPITTTLGNYVLNKRILADVFGSLIPYIENTDGKASFDPGKLDKIVARLIIDKKAGRKEYNAYMRNGYFLGHLTQLGVPALSRKSLSTSPEIEKLKKELLDKHKDDLDNPLVYTAIENELIAKDKEYLKNDTSHKFFAITAKKSFNEHRKKMYLTFGIMPQFDDKPNKFQTIVHSLSDGLTVPDLMKSNNEVRRGVYSRSKGTAKGGEQTDLLLRFLNSVEIVEDDCKSTEGIDIYLTTDNWKDYEGFTIIPDNVMITSDTKDKYLDKEVKIRSAMYCKSKGGFCFKCTGYLNKILENISIGVSSLSIGSKFTSIEMKSMHFSGINRNKLGGIDKYLME